MSKISDKIPSGGAVAPPAPPLSTPLMQGASLGGPNRRAKGWVGNDIKPAVPIGRQGGVETLNLGKYKLKYIFTFYLSIS